MSLLGIFDTGAFKNAVGLVFGQLLLRGKLYPVLRERGDLFQHVFNFSTFYFPVKNTDEKSTFKNANRNIQLATSVDPRI